MKRGMSEIRSQSKQPYRRPESGPAPQNRLSASIHCRWWGSPSLRRQPVDIYPFASSAPSFLFSAESFPFSGIFLSSPKSLSNLCKFFSISVNSYFPRTCCDKTTAPELTIYSNTAINHLLQVHRESFTSSQSQNGRCRTPHWRCPCSR